MLFMSRMMTDNETIEMTGAQQYSQYKGFMYGRDFVDSTSLDSWGRRKTCITAIDALCGLEEAQFEIRLMIRSFNMELNKAFCGFLPHKRELWKLDNGAEAGQTEVTELASEENEIGPSRSREESSEVDRRKVSSSWCSVHQVQSRVATCNWASGAFGGNLDLKSLLQWIASSEVFSSLSSFGDPLAKRLQEVIEWVVEEGWSVSEL
ncbi:hypothetical protein R1sor_019657 [Riccia sorocarpa]|uniref:PARG catalytic Macro domain-containing protein n=1 Tax=Riccia sorocarpa TaxID=122646 RepID=A0ABD3IGS1_9MARC